MITILLLIVAIASSSTDKCLVNIILNFKSLTSVFTQIYPRKVAC